MSATIPAAAGATKDVLACLREVLDAARVRAASAADAVDGVVPQAVVVPASAEDLGRILRTAGEQRLALVAVGGATLVATGNRPRAFDAAVSTEDLTSAPELRAEDMTVGVEAGVTLASVNAALAAAGQRIAVDAADAERATIGGLVAANATGGLAYGFGLPRDLVLGMTVVDGRGRTLRVGGRVVKNVAGYDLVRLFTGSFGSLGIITSVVLRTHPVPERSGTLAFRFGEPSALDAARARIFASALPLAALDFTTDGAGRGASWLLSARLEGTDSQWSYQHDRLMALCERGSAVDAAAAAEPPASTCLPRSDERLVVSLAARPTSAVELAAHLFGSADDASATRLYGRLGDGSVRVGCDTADPARCEAIVRSLAAVARARSLPMVVERAPAELKAKIDVWGEPGPTMILHERIKRSFDPHGVLAPGRFVGRL